jgi:hypothetical protein
MININNIYVNIYWTPNITNNILPFTINYSPYNKLPH